MSGFVAVEAAISLWVRHRGTHQLIHSRLPRESTGLYVGRRAVHTVAARADGACVSDGFTRDRERRAVARAGRGGIGGAGQGSQSMRLGAGIAYSFKYCAVHVSIPWFVALPSCDAELGRERTGA